MMNVTTKGEDFLIAVMEVQADAQPFFSFRHCRAADGPDVETAFLQGAAEPKGFFIALSIDTLNGGGVLAAVHLVLRGQIILQERTFTLQEYDVVGTGQ